MRDLIVRFLELVSALFPRTPGKHSAAYFDGQTVPTQPTPPEPKRLPAHVQERNRPLDAEAVALIRPYYAAHLAAQDERQREAKAKQQRQRQRELFWATLGMDYPGVRLTGGASA
ncbi:hypothetical protein [Streptomyces sp. ISL-100]|uniref:hypothetical protein n=1 Tax=Streptomyces sp. ISL-100 TaxID=2819173 RepID=UPI001BE88F4A|nr:hypothetical protein [Streptomyces sp. ISL-100]MBT2401283.1 hypothetical protein [Streptomyces sp. ISL-100]